MSKTQFEAAKQRLGAQEEPETELKHPQADAAQSAKDSNIIVDDDGFLVGVRVRSEKDNKGRYVLNDGVFAGYPVQYRALLPIDYFMLKGSPVTAGMVSLGLDPQNDKQHDEYIAGLSSAEISQIYTESSKLIVLQAVEKPLLTDAPPERCPPNRISIQELSLTDILGLRGAIEELSGVKEQEATFREADKKDNADADGSESSGAVESDDSGADSESVGESAE